MSEKKTAPAPLSRAEEKCPPPPGMLVDALQDRPHTEARKSRAAVSVKMPAPLDLDALEELVVKGSPGPFGVNRIDEDAGWLNYQVQAHPPVDSEHPDFGHVLGQHIDHRNPKARINAEREAALLNAAPALIAGCRERDDALEYIATSGDDCYHAEDGVAVLVKRLWNDMRIARARVEELEAEIAHLQGCLDSSGNALDAVSDVVRRTNAETYAGAMAVAVGVVEEELDTEETTQDQSHEDWNRGHDAACSNILTELRAASSTVKEPRVCGTCRGEGRLREWPHGGDCQCDRCLADHGPCPDCKDGIRYEDPTI